MQSTMLFLILPSTSTSSGVLVTQVQDIHHDLFHHRRVGLDPQSPLTPRGFMVTNNAYFTAPAAYPNVYMAGLAVESLGNSSVRYRLGLFPLINPTESLSSDLVQGHFKDDPVLDKVDELTITTGSSTHVFVDPGTGKPTPIPDSWRKGLRRLMQKNNWGDPGKLLPGYLCLVHL